MTKPEKELCDCLSCVLLGTPEKPEISDFATLLAVADHHSVTALLADLPKDCLQKVERILLQIYHCVGSLHLSINDGKERPIR